LRFLESLGATVTLRKQGDGPYRTDGGNMIVDSRFGAIADAPSLAAKLEARAGVIAHCLLLERFLFTLNRIWDSPTRR
jgi:ribose 5-phosphate isomerase A